MKIAIDAQGLQTQSRFRGVGRYIRGLLRALLAHNSNYEIILTANAALLSNAPPLLNEFFGLQDKVRLKTWKGVKTPFRNFQEWKKSQLAMTRAQEVLYSELRPDLIFAPTTLSEFLEPFSFNISCLRKYAPVGVFVHDFLPYLDPDLFFKKSRVLRQLYSIYMDDLKSAGLIFTSSGHVASQARIIFPDKKIVPISADADEIFTANRTGTVPLQKICERLGRTRGFILYAGGIDQRKNIENLLIAYEQLPESLKNDFPLVIVKGKTKRSLDGISENIILLDYVADEDLVSLYQSCSLFVFPSMSEGFGLPVLEAMRCGAPVIASSTSSIPEVAGNREALFDPANPDSIKAKMEQALRDRDFYQKLLDFSSTQSGKFSWKNTATLFFDALEKADLPNHALPQANGLEEKGYLPGKSCGSVRRDEIRVLFHSWPCAFDCPGGGEIQLLKYEEYLEKRGIRVLRFDSWNPQIKEADIIHHFSSVGNDINFFGYIKSHYSKPLVISPIFWPDAKNKYDLATLSANYSLADYVLPNSVMECEQIRLLLNTGSARFVPIINGVDDIFFKKESPGIFRDFFDIREPFVLCMGNIEPRKNQLKLIAALAGLGIKLILAGNRRDEAYARQCEAAGLGFVRHIGNLEHGSELQRSAYAAANALVLPSLLETPGLAALEAAAAGTPVAVTSVGSTREYFREYAQYLLPSSVASIRAAVMKAFNSERSDALANFVRKNYTWDIAVDQLVEVYETALKNRRPASRQEFASSHVSAYSAEMPLSFNSFEDNGKRIQDKRYIHLTGEERSDLLFSKSGFEPGSYAFTLAYSLLGSAEVKCEASINKQTVKEELLQPGKGRFFSSTFKIKDRQDTLGLKIFVPEGCFFICDRFAITQIGDTPLLGAQNISHGEPEPLEESVYAVSPGQFPCEQMAGNGDMPAKLNIHGPAFPLPPGQYRLLLFYSAQVEAICNIGPLSAKSGLPVERHILPPGEWRRAAILASFPEAGAPADFLQIICGDDFALHGVILENRFSGKKRCAPDARNYDPFGLFTDLWPMAGWHTPENNGVWTSDVKSGFHLQTNSEDVFLQFTVKPFLGSRKFRSLRILANGKEIYRDKLRDEKVVNCIIPAGMVDADGYAHIELESGEPLCSMWEAGTGMDKRKLGFKLGKLKITPITEIGKKGATISPFSPVTSDNAGWYRPDDGGTWTAAKESAFLLRSGWRDLFLEMDVKPYPGKEGFRTLSLSVNGRKLVREKLERPKTLRCIVPAALADGDGELAFEVASEEPLVSPLECGLGNDERPLGFKIESLRATPITEIGQKDAAISPFSPVTSDNVGWHGSEAAGTWTAAETSSFFIKPGRRDFILELHAQPFLGSLRERTLSLRIGGEEVAEAKMAGPQNVSCLVRSGYTDENGFARIDIISREPLFSQKDCGLGNDTRKLGFRINGMNIVTIPKSIDAGLLLSPFYPAALKGWHKREKNGVWSASENSEFYLARSDRPVFMSITLRPFLGGAESRSLRINVNGQELFAARINSTSTLNLSVPRELAGREDLMRISIGTDEPLLSPAECGKSGDVRKLGFFITEVLVKNAE